MNKEKNINLLWTGGWDSTFQLLQSVLLYKKKVQPYYLVDPNRRSLNMELIAIRKVKNALEENFPDSKKYMLPVKILLVDDIHIDSEIEKAFFELKNEKHIGIQYLWLASFCEEKGISDMQLSVEKSVDPNPNLWDSNLEGKLVTDKQHDQEVYVLSEHFMKTKEYKLFKYFTFPLIETTKTEMKEISFENNWVDIINLSWFCLFPTSKNQPCGVCNPCKQTISEGFGYRIPWKRRLNSTYVRNLQEPLKIRLKTTFGFLGIFP